MIYDVDYYLQSERLCPPKKRLPRYLAWLKVIVTPLQNVHDDFFVTYRPDIIERMKYNSQTIILEAILNKKFGTQYRDIPAVSDIFIVNNAGSGNVIYLSDKGDGNTVTYLGDKPSDADTVYFGNQSDYMPDFDFTVFIPTALITSLTAQVINAEIAKYAIAGTNWNLQGY